MSKFGNGLALHLIKEWKHYNSIYMGNGPRPIEPWAEAL